MLYLLLILAVMAVAYAGLRAVRAAAQPPRRVIGPDDDPEFLRRIS